MKAKVIMLPYRGEGINGCIYLDKGKEFGGCLCIEQFKPIPLTEEWLINFGFGGNWSIPCFEIFKF